MKFSKLMLWLLLAIIGACVAACSSDSNDETLPDVPNIPENREDIRGYWKHDGGFIIFNDNNDMIEIYYDEDDGVVVDNNKFYLDVDARKIVCWWEPWDYAAFEIKSMTSSALSIAELREDPSKEFGEWPKFDERTAQQIVNYYNSRPCLTDPAIYMKRSSKSEAEKWMEEMSNDTSNNPDIDSRLIGRWVGTDGDDTITCEFRADGTYIDWLNGNQYEEKGEFAYKDGVIDLPSNANMCNLWGSHYKVKFNSSSKMTWTNNLLDQWDYEFVFTKK